MNTENGTPSELEPAEVYFTNMRIGPGDSAPAKLRRLIAAAGFNAADHAGEYVALKSHIGEYENVSYLRPAYARAVAELLKAGGAKPFMVDCTTLYIGKRNNAIDFLECAEINGYTTQSIGCPIIIGDGIRGTDEVIVPLPAGATLDSAYIGHAIIDTDYLITITHAKGCKVTGFSGCIKNVAMGCASRAGKMIMHAGTAPAVNTELCSGCGSCLKACANNGITIQDGKAFINANCLSCGHCVSYCKTGAMQPAFGFQLADLQKRIAEYAAAVLLNKPAFHIALAIDVTAGCDCFADNDCAVVGDVGMFASFDPVALDRACENAINRQLPLPDTMLSAAMAAAEQKDYFTTMYPATDWEIANQHAESLGLGTRNYRIIEVD